jgi:hypothetical protein
MFSHSNEISPCTEFPTGTVEEWLSGVGEDLRAKTYQPQRLLETPTQRPARLNLRGRQGLRIADIETGEIQVLTEGRTDNFPDWSALRHYWCWLANVEALSANVGSNYRPETGGVLNQIPFGASDRAATMSGQPSPLKSANAMP